MNMPAPHLPVPAIPDTLTCAADYECHGAARLPGDIQAWLDGGSGEDLTARANVAACRAWRLVPRQLAPLTPPSTSVRLGPLTLPHPILLAPVAAHGLVSPQAELDTAHGAAVASSCLVLSAMSTREPEEIAQVPALRRWYQLPVGPTRPAMLEEIRRAEALGFEAVVVTLDAALQRPSRQALHAGFRLPASAVRRSARSPAANATSVFERRAQGALGRQDLAWLTEVTRLPVFVKGVLHPDDARVLSTLGVHGIVVSNHGGRTVDGVCASLDALPAVRAAVGDDFPVLFDGGIRAGSDVFTALALGADAVLVGRLQLHALAVAGALGVAHLLRLLREELELQMAVAGCADIAAVRRATLRREAAGVSACCR